MVDFLVFIALVVHQNCVVQSQDPHANNTEISGRSPCVDFYHSVAMDQSINGPLPVRSPRSFLRARIEAETTQESVDDLLLFTANTALNGPLCKWTTSKMDHFLNGPVLGFASQRDLHRYGVDSVATHVPVFAH